MTAEALADALPPRVTRASVDLPTATVGSHYRAELPTFTDPGGKGLRLTAGGLPGGLSFSDLGGGKGAIEGVPHEAASASVRIVATNHNNRTAQMSAALVVADKPAPSPGPVAKLEPRPSQPAPVPAPQAPASTQPAASHEPAAASQVPAPAPPAALQSSPPAAAGQTAPPAASPSAPTPQTVARIETPRPEAPAAVIAAPSAAAPAQTANLAPPVAPPIAPPVAPASPEEKAKAFIASFDGGECFLIEPLPGADRPHEYQAVGREIEPFRRFDAAYKREVGVEADLTLAPISAAQCPALDLVRLAAPVGQEPPRLTLKAYEVGPGKPLQGTISNLKGRHPYLVLVDNDGVAHRLEATVDASADFATFDVPLTPDASSVGPMQMLLAIASDKPVPALDALHSTNLKLIASRLVDEARRASASVEADYFKFVN